MSLLLRQRAAREKDGERKTEKVQLLTVCIRGREQKCEANVLYCYLLKIATNRI